MRNVFGTIGVIVLLVILYLAAWPVPIKPVAWEAPKNTGYTGPFAHNDQLKHIENLNIGNNHGPEDVALDAQGRIYVSTQEGHIVRLMPDGSNPENWVQTGGRPLGLDFDNDGNLIIADAVRGLLSVSPNGALTELATNADAVPIGYADDVDVAANGKIYFSDASTKFGARKWGLDATRDLLEHGGHGRVLVFDPQSRQTTTVLKGLNFANGVAVSPNQQYILVNETGAYRTIRVWIEGEKRGQAEPFLEGLPGFPDNISTGKDGRFWVAVAAPRSQTLDDLSSRPFLRKVILRLPTFMAPKVAPYGHIFAVDNEGTIVADLQDPNGKYPGNTSVIETDKYLYIGSFTAPNLARIPKDKIGL